MIHRVDVRFCRSTFLVRMHRASPLTLALGAHIMWRDARGQRLGPWIQMPWSSKLQSSHIGPSTLSPNREQQTSIVIRGYGRYISILGRGRVLIGGRCPSVLSSPLPLRPPLPLSVPLSLSLHPIPLPFYPYFSVSLSLVPIARSSSTASQILA